MGWMSTVIGSFGDSVMVGGAVLGVEGGDCVTEVEAVLVVGTVGQQLHSLDCCASRVECLRRQQQALYHLLRATPPLVQFP